MPKVDKLILFPMPEPTTRLAALRTGQVDFIEVPPPDAIAGLKRDGFQIIVRPYPHNWPYSSISTRTLEQQARPAGGQLCHRPRRTVQVSSE